MLPLTLLLSLALPRAHADDAPVDPAPAAAATPAQAPAPPPAAEPPPAPAPPPAAEPPPAPPDPRPARLVHAQLGTLTTGGTVAQAVDYRSTPTMLGIGGGYELDDNLMLTVDYLGMRRSAHTRSDANAPLRVAYTGHLLSVGARAQLPIGDVVVPYARFAVTGGLGLLALDDSPDIDDGRHVRSSGVTAGGVAALGVEVTVPNQSAYRPSFGFEAGVGGLARHTYNQRDAQGTKAPIGHLWMGPASVRATAGVRF